jgi:bifunctional non-homologous end joining protein LigD
MKTDVPPSARCRTRVVDDADRLFRVRRDGPGRPQRDERAARGAAQLLEKRVLPKLGDPVRYIGELDANLRDLVESVKAQGLEGLVAKRRDSRYESGQRSGAWLKMRINRGQEFVIGGYTIGTNTFDALIFGYYDADRLIYVARTRNGFTPALRAQLFRKFRGLEIPDCPVRESAPRKERPLGTGVDEGEDEGLPLAEAAAGRPVRVPRMDRRHHLRHTKFVGLARGQGRA